MDQQKQKHGHGLRHGHGHGRAEAPQLELFICHWSAFCKHIKTRQGENHLHMTFKLP
jgi:hypothetical protein